MTDARPAFFRDFPVLWTERLVLRRITLGDVPALFEMLSDPVVMRYMSSLPLTSESEAAAVVERIGAAWDEGRGIEWGITLHGDDRLVGKCAFYRLHAAHARAELGYFLAPGCWGRGLATEAVGAVLDFGFGTMGLHSVEVQTDPDNGSSIGVARRLGFRPEGHQRENFRVADRFFDTLLFGLLAREWTALRTLPPSVRSEAGQTA
jgi:ribosomal-protein-alanine N-acetyltransferase